jgi:glycosyltransferase involved in cell wall biosynthesis
MEAVTSSSTSQHAGLVPGETQIVLLSFEGPDRYARRGSLGDQVTGLASAFAGAGFATTLIFIGDPEAPHEEQHAMAGGGTLRLIRWSQWISRYYPGGPYEDEDARVHDYTEYVPPFLTQLEAVTSPSPDPGAGRPALIVIAHEWQTSGALLGLDRLLRQSGKRQRALLVWTLQHVLNLAHVDLPALTGACSVATVSRYLKHELWKHGLDPLVFPPGVDDTYFQAPEVLAGDSAVRSAAALAQDRQVLFAPELTPEWETMVYGAVATLKRLGRRPLLIVGRPVAIAASSLAGAPDLTFGAFGGLETVAPAPTVDVLICGARPDVGTVRTLQDAASATLLLGDATGVSLLQAMAGGAVCVTDDAMSDALIPFENGVGLETRSPAELVATLLELERDPARLQAMRATARTTAEGSAWPHVLATLLVKLEFLAGAL